MVDDCYGDGEVEDSSWMREREVVGYECRVWFMLFCDFGQIG
jgi:hypothetical protein